MSRANAKILILSVFGIAFYAFWMPLVSAPLLDKALADLSAITSVKADPGQYSVDILAPTLDMVFLFAIINMLKHTAFLRASGRRQFLFYGK